MYDQRDEHSFVPKIDPRSQQLASKFRETSAERLTRERGDSPQMYPPSHSFRPQIDPRS